MPGDPTRTAPAADPAPSVEDRLAALEAVVGTGEVRTCRLVVTDDAGEKRIVAEVVHGHADLRVLVAGAVHGEGSMVMLSAGANPGFGPMVGVHLWAEGDQVAEFSAWQEDGTEGWRTSLVAADDPDEDHTGGPLDDPRPPVPDELRRPTAGPYHRRRERSGERTGERTTVVSPAALVDVDEGSSSGRPGRVLRPSAATPRRGDTVERPEPTSWSAGANP